MKMKKSSRYEKCKEHMQTEGLDATIAISPENVLYFSEAYIMTQTDLRERLAITVMPIESDPVMIACTVEKNTVEEETWIADKRYYTEFLQSPIELLVEVLKEKKLEHKKIGIELNYLMAHYYKELVESLPNTQFVACARIFDKVRMIKEEEEIEILANAGFQTRKAFEAAVLMTKPGNTETDLANKTIRNLYDLGSEKLDFISLCSGKRSLLVHGLPKDVPLMGGDLVRIDFGGVFKNYLSDVARTALIGKKNDKFIDIFSRLAEAYISTFEMLKIGTPAYEIYNFAEKKFAEVALPFTMHLTGHGIGIGPHEMPVLSPTEEQPLMANMILCFEQSVHMEGRRFHIEDLVRITPKGPEILTEHILDPKLLWIS